MSTTATTAASSFTYYLRVRQEWLDRRKEAILEPDLPIVDPHHHLWDRPDWRYLLDELLADTNSGHNIVATVFVQARAMLRASGPAEMRHVGETEFVNGVAAMSASGLYGKTRHCAGIVGHADLALGSRVEPVLAAHIRAGGDRFRGIRHITAWDADKSVRNPAYSPPAGLLSDNTFREGFAVLGRLGLSFDAWLYHRQIDEVAGLARLCGDQDCPQSCRRPDRHRCLCRQAPGGAARLGRFDQGACRLSQRLCQARRPRHAPGRLRLP